MRAGPGSGRFPRYTSVLTGSLMALLALFAFGLVTPAQATAPAHQKASRVIAAPVSAHNRCGGHVHNDRHSRVRGGRDKCRYQQVSHTEQCGPDTFCEATATCPPGTVVTGGGIGTNTFISDQVWLYETKPTSDTTWQGTYRNRTNITFPITAWAVCANLT